MAAGPYTGEWQAHEEHVSISSHGTGTEVSNYGTVYRAKGWDLESASDIVWESVEGRCPEYLDAVKRAVRSYGDPS